MNKLWPKSKLEFFFALWALVLPITSIVVIPSIPGSTLAYFLAFSSLPLAILFAPRQLGELFRSLMFILVPFLVLTLLAQFTLQAHWQIQLDTLRLVNIDDKSLFWRSSLFTQSLYLLPGLLTFVFVKTFYKPSWDRYIFSGALLLAVYGFYEFGFYLLTGNNGDFLSNRVFDNGVVVAAGSSFQTMTVAGVSIMRLKSLTGEPSMYAFTILPYWIYAIHRRKIGVQLVLLVSLLLSTATTAFFGVIVYFLCRLAFLKFFKRLASGYADKWITICVIAILLASMTIYPIINVFVQQALDKFTAANASGLDRSSYFQASLDFFISAPSSIQFFGLGFGYIRSTDFFMTLLVNTGILGLVLFCVLFFYPIFKLDSSYHSIGLRSALVIIFTTLMISVSEFSYLSTWLFLGLCYHVIGKENNATLH